MTREVRPFVLLSDGTSGGAAIACSRLHRGLRGLGCNASWMALNGLSCDASIAAAWPPLTAVLLHRLVMAVTRSEWPRRWVCDRLGNSTMLSFLRKFRPRLINLHNIHEGMTFRLLERLPSKIPLVWTLHDMWPITGYCCYSEACEKYATGCTGTCPQMGAWGKALRSPGREWRRRDALFRAIQERLVLVSPSQWLAECASRRVPRGVRVEHIPNGIDMDIFRPLPQREIARQVLGLPNDRPIIMAGACSLDDRRKGTHVLAAALSRLKADGLRFAFVAFGESHAPPMEGEYKLGAVRDEMTLNLCYNAADVFVLPSLADNLPNTLVEAQAAGTPCVTTNVGGCPEVVSHGRTGFVARAGDEEDLATHIHAMLRMSQPESDAMRGESRETAKRRYALASQATRYASVFKEVMDGQFRCDILRKAPR